MQCSGVFWSAIERRGNAVGMPYERRRHAHSSIIAVPMPRVHSEHSYNAIDTPVHAWSTQGSPCCFAVHDPPELYRNAVASHENAIRMPQAVQGHRVNSPLNSAFLFMGISERRATYYTIRRYDVLPLCSIHVGYPTTLSGVGTQSWYGNACVLWALSL